MNNIVNIPGRQPTDRSAIEAEARAWLVQLDGGRPTPEELNEFHDWLARSPVHRESFRRAAAAWNQLDGLAEWLDHAEAKTARRASTHGAIAGLLNRVLAPAAAALLVVIGLTAALTVYLSGPKTSPETAYTAEYNTAIGELQSLSLPDGSRVRLNTDSHMDVSFRGGVRAVRLPRGEAWFDVAPDSDRPFVVSAGRVVVWAVGTAFSVHVRASKVETTVTEGRIEMASLARRVTSLSEFDMASLDKALSRVPLAEGQHAVFDEDIELVQRIEPEQIEKRLSWRDGMLVFNNDTLEDVVTEINRYTPMKIVISDPSLRRLRFGGYFQTSDVASILATFEEGFSIRVEKVKPNLVYLSRRRDAD